MLKKIAAIFAIVLLTVIAHHIRLARLTLQAFEPHISNKTHIINYNDSGLSLYDRHDQLFFTFYQAKPKQTVPLSEISPVMRQAVIAIEDRHFLEHFGFSPPGIVRATVWNLTEGKVVAGGSTITQQLVKNSLLTPQKSFRRKYQELVLALAIEQRYSKADILEMYLNSIYFGQGAVGVEQAAQTYFNTSARDLTLEQATYLAALMPAPSELSSHDNGISIATRRRQSLVLDAMLRENMITIDQKEAVITNQLTFKDPPIPPNAVAPHFALYVRDQLIKQFGEQAIVRSGYKVKTTIDLKQQQYAQQAVAAQVEKLRGQGAHNGAAVIIDPPTGHILAMVGSTSWSDARFGKMNMAIQPRQPGSSFKPIVYATAFERHLATPATILHDKPQTFGKDYRPTNYDGRFRGPVIARRALVNSLNVPAVELINTTGPANVIKTAEKFGINTLSPQYDNNLSLALGSGAVSLLEMTGAYATFANSGYYQPPAAIISIEDRKGEVIDPSPSHNEPNQAVSSSTAYQITNILSDSKTRTDVFGPSLNTTAEAAVKTGTTQSYRDAWTLGYTPHLAIGIWIGNNDNTPMQNLPGLTAAGPVWRQLTENFSTALAAQQFIQPPSLIALSICPWNGLPYRGPGQVGYTEYFQIGTEPSGRCTPKPPEEKEKEGEEENPEDSDNSDDDTQQATKPRKEKPQPPPKPDKEEIDITRGWYTIDAAHAGQ